MKDSANNLPLCMTPHRFLPQGSNAEEAEQWLRRAVALAPNDALAHKHLGESHKYLELTTN